MNHRSWSLVLATGAALGVSVPLGKVAVSHGITPLEFVLLPALPIALLLAALAWWRHGLPREPGRLAGFGLVAGLLGSALPNTLAAWVSGRAGAGMTGMAFTLPPLLTLLLALLLRMEAVRWQRLLAVLLGLAGAVWLAGARMNAGRLQALEAATLLAIPAAIALGNVLRPLLLPRTAQAEWLGASMWISVFALLLPVWLLQPPAGARASAGLPWVGLQVLVGAGAAILYFQLQRRAEPVAMSFIGYALAATAVLLGTLLLGERLPWQLLPASALIAAGFWLIQLHPPLARPAGCGRAA